MEFVSQLICCREGDKITLEGEADQIPDQEPGDIVFTLIQTEHINYLRSGADLQATIEITLAEALCGFSRVVIRHLDGRGIQINHLNSKARVLEPGQVIKVEGEGMPHKKSDVKGDLYLIVKVKFPDKRWLETNQAAEKLQQLLPKTEKPIAADVVDEVTYDENASLESFGEDEQGGDGGWIDEDEDNGQPQCSQQ